MNNKDIYLVAFYHMKPRPGVKTTVKGWMDDKNNITYDETIEITRGLKKNAAMSKVVLNLSKKTVDRNTWGTERTFNEYFKHYFMGYHKYVTTVMTQLDAEYMNSMLDEMQAELDASKDAQEVSAE
jgi:hypothetical protein